MDKLRNIRRHDCKERLKIGEIAKFESNLLKTNEDIAPQRCEILQTFVWCGGGAPCERLKITTTLQTYIFTRLRRITFKPGNFANFKALFQMMSTDFP